MRNVYLNWNSHIKFSEWVSEMMGYCKSGNQNPGNFGYFNSRFSMVLEEVAIGLYYSNIEKVLFCIKLNNLHGRVISISLSGKHVELLFENFLFILPNLQKELRLAKIISFLGQLTYIMKM